MNDAAKALKKANADLDVDKVSSHPSITKRPYNVNSVYFGLSDDVNDEYRLLFVFGLMELIQLSFFITEFVFKHVG